MFTLYYKQRSFRLYNRGSEKSMKRALIITTVSGFVPQFEMNNVKILQNLGYEIHYAANYHMPVYTDNNERLEGTGIIQHQIDFVRSPYNIGKNIKALNQLISLMRKIKFHLVHCHTPMGGVLGRIAAHKTNTKPVIYTAHGFHFYKGAPVWNWLFFYPVERFLAHWTDCLITINKEDYKRACKFKVRDKVEYVPGVGIDIEKYQNIKVNRQEMRKRLGIPQDAFLLISVGELTKRKNHQVVIQALKKCNSKNIYYIICGSGVLRERLKKQIKKGNLEKQVFLLGYRIDIPELLNCSDCFVFPSLQEGLSIALLEALVMQLPVICFDIRGNNDFMDEGVGEIIFVNNNSQNMMKSIMDYKRGVLNPLCDFEDRKNILRKKYGFPTISEKMKKIYGGID